MSKKQVVSKSRNFVPVEIIQNKIYLIRGYKVMLDTDLARLYGVPTKSLNLAVKRNLVRFPETSHFFNIPRTDFFWRGLQMCTCRHNYFFPFFSENFSQCIHGRCLATTADQRK